MNPAVCRIALAALSALLIAGSSVRSSAQNDPTSDGGDIASLCRGVISEFAPLSPSDLQAARIELAAASARLEARLTAEEDNGIAWRKYLLWGSLQEALQGEGALDSAVIEKVLGRFDAKHKGLGLKSFVDVRDGLRSYQEISLAIEHTAFQDEYEQFMDRLADLLQAYSAKRTARDAEVIGLAVRWLRDIRRAPRLVQAVQDQWVRPNLMIDVSAKMVRSAIEDEIDEVAPIRDVILDTRIRGTGHTTGQITAHLHPRPAAGAIDVLFRGINVSKNTGYHGSIRIYSDGTTQLEARQRILITDKGLRLLPVDSRADAVSKITDIKSRQNIRLIERLAWRRVKTQKAEGDCIASRHAELRIAERIQQQTGELISRANRAFVEKFRRPLMQQGLFPRQLDFSTTDHSLAAVALQANRFHLAASTAPAKLPERFDVAVRMHESMINNLASEALSGETFSDEDLRRILTELLGELPDSLQQDEADEPWGIVFARSRPIAVSFHEDGFQVVIRGRSFFQGETGLPGMSATADYKIVAAEDGFKAVRQGPLQVDPINFKVPNEKKLTRLQAPTRRMLRKRLGKLLREELPVASFTFSGQLEKLGPVRPVAMTTRDGWLTVAFCVE